MVVAKTRKLQSRCTEQDEQAIKKLADEQNLSVSAWLHLLAKQEIAKAQIEKLKININQLEVKHFTLESRVAMLEELIELASNKILENRERLDKHDQQLNYPS